MGMHLLAFVSVLIFFKARVFQPLFSASVRLCVYAHIRVDRALVVPAHCKADTVLHLLRAVAHCFQRLSLIGVWAACEAIEHAAFGTLCPEVK